MPKKTKQFHFSLLQVIWLLSVIILQFGCRRSTPAETQSISLFATASTTSLMEELAREFYTNTGLKIEINSASSGTLARQIQSGAEADVYLSAAPEWCEFLVTENLVDPSDVHPFLKNQLVLIVSQKTSLPEVQFPNNFDLTSYHFSRIAIGDPTHVPAGKYAIQAINSFGWYEKMKDRQLSAIDTRAIVRYVELGEAELGIVFQTDAKQSAEVKISGIFPQDSHDPILYQISIIKNSKNRQETNAFLQWLNSAPAQEIIQKHGFSLPSTEQANNSEMQILYHEQL